jgi:Zn-dependent peptidase ImmA (M78 family)
MHEFINISPADLLKKLGLISPPYNPFEIAKKLKLQVDQKLDFKNVSLSGYISRNNGEMFVWINPLDSDVRQRFTLAHEIGHYVNDFLPDLNLKEIIDTPDTLYRNGNSDIRETAANKFAANLLMPKDDVIEQGNKLIEGTVEKSMSGVDFVSKMAEKFEVSKPAMLVRLKTLGVIQQNFQM